MVEGGECLRLALEAGQPVWIVCKGLRQHFDRDVAPEDGVRRAVHLAHAAHANLRGHCVGSETGANAQRRRWVQVRADSTG